MTCYMIRNLIICVSIRTWCIPYPLTCYIIWKFTLIHIAFAAITIPDCLVFLEMLYHQSISSNIITIKDYSGITSILVPCNTCSMVSSPNPEVISNNIIAVNNYTICCLTRCGICSTYSIECINKTCWIC